MTGTVETKLNNNRLNVDQIQSFDALICDEQKTVIVTSGIKLGWIKGVLVPCLLSIWGVMLFLKMPWILGQAGILDSILVILISLIIILITTFSLSAVSTNGRVTGGGLYFIISRSIGPGIGASIGILLALANIISAAINTIGFCQSLRSFLLNYDIQIMRYNFIFKTVGVISIIIMGILCGIGMDREAQVQNVLLISIVVGILNVLIGSYIGPTSVIAKASGFTGFSIQTFKKNWHPNYRVENNIQHSFFTIFSIFFPSVTGIQAGANISGDLKDPSASIPKGTLLSILITITSYILLIVVPGSVQLREASGIFEEYDSGFYLNCSMRNCTKGLYNDKDLMQLIAWWPFSIYIGCWGATISTALTALISVPKLLQRMGQDDVYPLLKYLAKGYGKSQEPYRAHLFTITVSSILFIIGDIEKIAPIISTIYLCAYALLNFCTFHVAYFKPLGWRPSYKFYNKWLSFAGTIICISVMIFIDKLMSAIIGCAICILYKIAVRKKFVINWGSSRKTQLLKSIMDRMYMVNSIEYHVKNYLPNLMVLSGKPESRKKLISFANLITKNNGLQVCINVEKETLTMKQKKKYLNQGIQWLKSANMKSLYIVLDNTELDVATNMTYSCGHGQLKPNIVVVGYKSDWLNCPKKDLQSFLNIFNVANTNGFASIMIRVSSTENTEHQHLIMNKFEPENNNTDMTHKTKLNQKKRNQHKVSDCSIIMKNNEFSFTNKKKKIHGTVDIWWLYDDGGLSLIVASIFKSNPMWKHCKFRIFGVTDKKECLLLEKNKLKQLLSIYRINIFDYVDVILANTTDPTTMMYFTSLSKHIASKECHANDSRSSKKYNCNTLFLRDLIELHSLKSDLVILSTPRTDEKMDTLFMCWIETMTRGLPPCIVINADKVPILTGNA